MRTWELENWTLLRFFHQEQGFCSRFDVSLVHGYLVKEGSPEILESQIEADKSHVFYVPIPEVKKHITIAQTP